MERASLQGVCFCCRVLLQSAHSTLTAAHPAATPCAAPASPPKAHATLQRHPEKHQCPLQSTHRLDSQAKQHPAAAPCTGTSTTLKQHRSSDTLQRHQQHPEKLERHCSCTPKRTLQQHPAAHQHATCSGAATLQRNLQPSSTSTRKQHPAAASCNSALQRHPAAAPSASMPARKRTPPAATPGSGNTTCFFQKADMQLLLLYLK